MMRRWLQQLLTPVKVKSLIAGWLTTASSAGVFVILLGVGVTPVVANLACKTATTQVRFAIKRTLTWKHIRSTSPWSQWRRYQLQKCITTTANQALFWLATYFDYHYLLAYFGCTFLVMPLSYCIAKFYTFKQGE